MIQRTTRMVVAWGWRRGENEQLLFNGYGDSVLQDGNSSGDGW